ncbi:MAG: phosphoribosyltransferase family protein [Tissierellia bacterium]|nr:phosphoribosyltransferase family protein [Tissierellia bacterium]
MKYYELKVAGLTRQLPIIPISGDLAIASFVLLGDQEMTTAAAKYLDKILPKVDGLMTAEAKGIPLVNELARIRNISHYVVARKSTKVYMENPLMVEVDSITTKNPQKLYLDQKDVERIQGKRIALVDDVISTGESLLAMEMLAKEAGAAVVAKGAILAEGKATQREDIIYLEELPLFYLNGNSMVE